MLRQTVTLATAILYRRHVFLIIRVRCGGLGIQCHPERQGHRGAISLFGRDTRWPRGLDDIV